MTYSISVIIPHIHYRHTAICRLTLQLGVAHIQDAEVVTKRTTEKWKLIHSTTLSIPQNIHSHMHLNKVCTERKRVKRCSDKVLNEEHMTGGGVDSQQGRGHMIVSLGACMCREMLQDRREGDFLYFSNKGLCGLAVLTDTLLFMCQGQGEKSCRQVFLKDPS